MINLAVGYGAALAIACALCGSIFWYVGSGVWHWISGPTDTVKVAPLPNGPLQAWTVYKDVPFIAISQEAFNFIQDKEVRLPLERDMLSRELFDATQLKAHTRYLPKLREVGDLWSAYTFMNGGVTKVAVQLISEDGKPGGAGLIPYDAYAHDIESLYK
jgi:hypothetical protein